MRWLSVAVFVAGVLLSGLSFLVYLGNALTGEGRSESVATAGILGILAGSFIAAAGPLMRAARLGRFVGVITGGLVGAAAWIVGLLMFSGGRAGLEYWLAVCIAPWGMWLGLLVHGRGRNDGGLEG